MKTHSLVVLAFACLASAGCADGSGTGGRSVFFDVAVQPPEYMSDGGSFTNERGWEVELDEAVIALGPVYVWEQPGYAGLARDHELDLSVDPVAWLGELVVPTAHAHPGDTHFDGGTLRGEYLDQVAFDLLGGEAAVLGTARGIAGDIGSLTIVLDPPNAATRGQVDDLRGFHAWVSGRARRGREIVEFEGGLAIPPEGIQRQVDGVPIDGELDDDGTLVLGVSPHAWFGDADFATLDTPNETGDRMVIEPTSQVANAWFIGARTTDAFSCRWTTDERFEDWEESAP
jgi:hypothetical protein